MENNSIKNILEEVKNGSMSIEDGLLNLKLQPFVELGYAKVDTHRKVRQGEVEVIFGQSKEPEHILGICKSLVEKGETNILVTRLSQEKYEFLKDKINISYDKISRVGVVEKKEIVGVGSVAVLTGGTADISVAEECAQTLEALGNNVQRIYDVGVAGLHRLLNKLPEIMSAKVIVAVAGMEGALASVVGGLVSVPVIGVPTSVGYGTSFNGMSALLSMLNSCASGVSVVNIDNGFGAGYLASMINKLGE